ncbi:hypothetical protein CNMCM5623_006109 [Aspergillus felis]|uniref:NmrA-like domain-containing protein n=1 Tax=Aspergillus felis TaxID=1287682 RepID=A0A8H6V0B0_9EURO|nr:hypothetical protein CNMCM5623_006109 [Aspergillus felis]
MTRPPVTKTVTVFGATGSQGGSVARSLLQNKNFRVVAITRNAASKAAQELRGLGAEIVQADGWNKEQIAAAFAGSWAAFVNTNSDDPCFHNDDGPTEFDLGKSIIDGIIKAKTVKHLVYSTAASTSDYSHGQVYTKTTQMKTRIAMYATDTGHFESVCPVYAGWYMEIFKNPDLANAFGGFPYFPDQDGFYTVSAPRWGTDTDMPVPWLAVEDFGDIVHGVLLAPQDYNGKCIPALSDCSSFPELAACFQQGMQNYRYRYIKYISANELYQATGKRARYVTLPSWNLLGAGVPQLEDVRRLFAFGQISNAKYFGDEPTSTTIPAHLKAEAVKAKGAESEESNLITWQKWFQKNL